MRHILYIHGMGGGADSRIPSILDNVFCTTAKVVTRTYSFDPEIAACQIASWVEELKPVLVIGESLGALHALRLRGIPHVFVSPALNAPIYFQILAWLTLVPGVTRLFDRIYRPREGDRQPLHFTFRTLRKYRRHRSEALKDLPSDTRSSLLCTKVDKASSRPSKSHGRSEKIIDVILLLLTISVFIYSS